MRTESRDARFLIGGAVMLAIAMGVGRFAYTPLIPAMEGDAGLTVATAGTLAFANLLGYLVGASLAMHPVTHGRRLAIARWSVATVIVTTLAMTLGSVLWLPLRFLTGVASGFAMIFSASIVLERSARAKCPAWPPLFFMGVGSGIAFSGIAVPALVAIGGSRAAWAGVAAASAIAFAVTGRGFFDEAPSAAVAAADIDGRLPSQKKTFGWLLAVYTVEAFAYVIPATFLVAIIKSVPAIAPYAGLAWVIVGLSGPLTTFPWIRVAARLGKAKTLGCALAVQAAGILAPAFTHSALAVAFTAVGLGGTFITITFLSAGLGRDMFPQKTSLAVSRLTVFYGVGQMLGPLVATQIALRTGSYDVALLAAGVAAALSSIVTFVLIREPLAVAPSARDLKRPA